MERFVNSTRKAFFTICVLVFSVLPVYGQSFAEKIEQHIEEDLGIDYQFDLGLAAVYRESIVGSLDQHNSELSAAVIVSGGAYYEDFFIESAPFANQPLTVGYTFAKSDDWQFNIVGQSWFTEISQEDQEQGNLLDGIQTRRASFEMGIEYVRQYTDADIRVRLLNDVLSRHDGFLFTADYNRPIFTNYALIMPSVGVIYLSENAVDYYYGVSANEATSFRTAYSPEGAWGASARLYIERPINKSFTAFAFANYVYFDEDITESPIVTIEQAAYNIAVGVLWTF
jgi:outer membrane scaffolding protein for murein synthesis (MipA/OmpV family)